MKAMVITQKKSLSEGLTLLLYLIIEPDMIFIDTSYAVGEHRLDGLKVYPALR